MDGEHLQGGAHQLCGDKSVRGNQRGLLRSGRVSAGSDPDWGELSKVGVPSTLAPESSGLMVSLQDGAEGSGPHTCTLECGLNSMCPSLCPRYLEGVWKWRPRKPASGPGRAAW